MCYVKSFLKIFFLLIIIIFLPPRYAYSSYLNDFSPSQQDAINKAISEDEDLGELIEYAPDLINFEEIFKDYSFQPSLIFNPGDANGDGIVNMMDYIIWITFYNKPYSPTSNVNPDFNNDGKVDGTDFVIWLGNYNKFYPTPTNVPFPTPTLRPTYTPTPTPRSTTSVTPTPKPNIILIVSDDQRHDSIQKMPFLNSQQENWFRFQNAFTNVSLCCPSRSTILSGLFSHHSGVEDNGSKRYFDENDNIVTKLDSAGYTTALIGKYLNKWTGETDEPYTPPGWDVFTPFMDPISYFNYKLVEEGVVKTYGDTPADYATDVLGQKALNFITEAKQPFFLYFSPYTPHSPFIPAPRHVGVDLSSVTLPPNFNEEDVSDKPEWIKNLPKRDPQEMLKHLKNQYRMLLSLDEWVENIYTALKDREIAYKTVIIYIGDNSFSHGEHRIVGKMCGYSYCNQIPLLIRYPQNTGRVINNPVSNVDIAPTLANIAGVNLMNVDGLSLVPLLNGSTQPPDQPSRGILTHWGGTGVYELPHFWGIVTDKWNYMELATGEKELYDRVNDPYELTNLANIPEYSQIQSRLRLDLIDLMNQ